MRDVLKSTRRWRYAGWMLPVVLLALPNCFLDSTGLGIPDQFDPGDAPLTGAILCDIPKVEELGANGDCANVDEVFSGMPIQHSAVALAEGVSSSLSLDFSPAATSACSGSPKKQLMEGPFPDGLAICLNCGQQIPAVFADATHACVVKCVDMVNNGGIFPPEGAQTFCENKAKVSINLDNACIGEACSPAGTLKPDFVDPRREQEKVKWVDLSGDATMDDNNLSKLTGVGGAFDSGARSEQLITHGDAWVEFAANETGVSHVVGISHENGSPDDPGLGDVEFCISLNFDGSVYLVEGAASVVNGPFPAYAPGERFRLRITDNNDGTASISYTRVVGACQPGTVCNETPIGPATLPSPSYPLRIQSTFREPGSTVSNVTLVRIKD